MRIRALLFAGLLIALSLVAAPANAANQISGTANFGSSCAAPPADFADFTSYPPIDMDGSLDGCWYTKILNFEQKPSGVYLESGKKSSSAVSMAAPRASSPQPINSRPSWTPLLAQRSKADASTRLLPGAEQVASTVLPDASISKTSSTGRPSPLLSTTTEVTLGSHDPRARFYQGT